MKWIRRVSLVQFQSHELSYFEFDPGLNVIVGPSDSGKSAVFRALRWALYNEPRGTDFVQVGARECRVTVTMSDGAEITREVLLSKSAARHRYLVTLPDQATQVFEAFGATIPTEVIRAHGMPEVLLDTDKQVALSIGSQLEGPFLLTETGSTRARAIGRLLGVHVVDAALRGTHRDLRNLKGTTTRSERDLARLDEEIQGFADIPNQERLLAAAESLLDRADLAARRRDQLKEIRDELERVAAQEIQLEAQLAKLDQLDQQAESILIEVEQRQARLRELIPLRNLAQDVANRLTKDRESLHQADRELNGALADYESLLTTLGRCPTCLQEVSPQTIRRIVGELSGGPASEHSH
jgi:exonuclease SbcC